MNRSVAHDLMHGELIGELRHRFVVEIEDIVSKIPAFWKEVLSKASEFAQVNGLQSIPEFGTIFIFVDLNVELFGSPVFFMFLATSRFFKGIGLHLLLLPPPVPQIMVTYVVLSRVTPGWISLRKSLQTSYRC